MVVAAFQELQFFVQLLLHMPACIEKEREFLLFHRHSLYTLPLGSTVRTIVYTFYCVFVVVALTSTSRLIGKHFHLITLDQSNAG